MRIGFTGTREGITAAQRAIFEGCFRATGATEFHHGACVGADAEVAVWVATVRMPQPAGAPTPQLTPWCRIHARPSNLPGMTDPAALRMSDFRYPEKPPLDRNRDIVDACDKLIACPRGPEEERSGTWATVRYARRVGRPVVVIWADGSMWGNPPRTDSED